MTVARSYWWALASIVVMIVGAVGPWAKVSISVFNATVNGTDDGKDGWIVVGAAIAAVLGLLVHFGVRRRWLAIVPLLAGLVGVATAGYDINDIGSTASEHGLPSSAVTTQWGVYTALVGSISLALAALGVWLETRRRTGDVRVEPV